MAKANDSILYLIATGFGSGLSPVAPGTVGSLAALLLVYLFWPSSFLLQVAIVVVTTLVGIWASGWLAESEGIEDPAKVVIDEFAGLFTAFLILPHDMMNWRGLALGFVLFRVFDIWKPWPISSLEQLPAGWGIMMDDVLAGVFAGILTYLALWTLT